MINLNIYDYHSTEKGENTTPRNDYNIQVQY